MILIKYQILVFERHFAHLAKEGEESARAFFGCERGRKISALCSMKSRIKVIKRKKKDWC